MAAARRDYEWDHTSLVVATLCNANRTKGKPVKPEDIHPTRTGNTSKGDHSVKLTRDNINVLKAFATNTVKEDGRNG